MVFESLSFKPVSVKKLFTDMKDTAELMVDLSYSAVFYDDEELAEEVLGLEELMDKLQYRARMSMMLSARNRKNAERLAPLMAIIGATEDISNAAGDIVKIVRQDLRVPNQVKRLISQTFEPVATINTDKNPDMVGKDFIEVFHPSIHVIALRRGGEWMINPGLERIRENDRMILKGPDEHVGKFRSDDKIFEESEDIEQVGNAVDTVVEMKDFSELALDLSYSSVFSNSKPIAEEVRELEEKIDGLLSDLIEWVLRAAKNFGDPVELKGLLQIAYSTETITDSAFEIAETVLRGMEVHPVFEKAMKESDEVVVRRRVETATRVEEFLEKSVVAMAVRKSSMESQEWVLMPEKHLMLREGDTIILKGDPEHLSQ